jgi:hypothetical protein
MAVVAVVRKYFMLLILFSHGSVLSISLASENRLIIVHKYVSCIRQPKTDVKLEKYLRRSTILMNHGRRLLSLKEISV